MILLQRIHCCFRRAGCSGPQGKKKTRVRAATRWRNLFLQLDSRRTTAPAAGVLRGCCPDRQAEAAPRRLHPRKWWLWYLTGGYYMQRDCPGGSNGKESACNAGDPSLIPGLGRSPGEGNGNPLQYSCLENSKDRGAWWVIIHRVAKSQTRLMTNTSTFTHAEKGW